jgi:hypothetical protein
MEKLQGPNWKEEQWSRKTYQHLEKLSIRCLPLTVGHRPGPGIAPPPPPVPPPPPSPFRDPSRSGTVRSPYLTVPEAATLSPRPPRRATAAVGASTPVPRAGQSNLSAWPSQARSSPLRSPASARAPRQSSPLSRLPGRASPSPPRAAGDPGTEVVPLSLTWSLSSSSFLSHLCSVRGACLRIRLTLGTRTLEGSPGQLGWVLFFSKVIAEIPKR